MEVQSCCIGIRNPDTLHSHNSSLLREGRIKNIDTGVVEAKMLKLGKDPKLVIVNLLSDM